jgi:hypothetical protein
MAERLMDTARPQKAAVRRTPERDVKSADDSNGAEPPSYKAETTTSLDDFMFHYPGFGCLGGVLAAGGCRNRLQTVSDAKLTDESVADVSKQWQSVSKRKKSADSGPRS